jgi:DNA-binding SARP family transcriptional activator
MKFALLGPLEIEGDDGTLIAIPQARHRTLAAALLLTGGHPVSASRLADMVWGDEQPARGASGALRTHIWGLRKLLPAGRLARSAAGYQLTVWPGELDVAEFRRLALLGQRLLADKRPEAAADALSQGVDLWREPPLADVPATLCLTGVIHQLREEYHAACEALIESRLALGQHRAVLPQLQAQVNAYPEHEQLGAQLLLALYQCGRRAEALAAYRRISALLAEDHGIAPGPELQRLHRQILTDDPLLRSRGGR